jgi:hypothetical protein
MLPAAPVLKPSRRPPRKADEPLGALAALIEVALEILVALLL